MQGREQKEIGKIIALCQKVKFLLWYWWTGQLLQAKALSTNLGDLG